MIRMRLDEVMRWPGRFDEEAMVNTPARPPFAEETLDFLAEVGRVLMKAPGAKAYPDVVTLGFWLRRAHLQELKAAHMPRTQNGLAVGRGVVFHIAPGNVAVNFAYSLFSAMLAGNSNIVKLSSKVFPQTGIILDILQTVCAKPEFAAFERTTAIVQYSADDELTAYFSSLCDVRVIWGGDETIRAVRKIPLPPRSTEILFADRYSVAAIKAAEVLKADSSWLDAAARGFYNDTYLMDQNACSAPRLVVWQGTGEDIARAKELFWPRVHKIVKREYELAPVLAVDKRTEALENAMEYLGARLQKDPDNLLVRVEVPFGELTRNIENIRTAGGYFIETGVEGLGQLTQVITKKWQTMAHFGYGREELAEWVAAHRPPGIDRVVPFGQATAFGLVWDGVDLMGALSRCVDIGSGAGK